MSETISITAAAPDLHKASPERNPERFRGTNPLDRLPPHSVEAEQGVLGCVLLQPMENIPECVNRFRGQERAFYDVRHQVIFKALVEMQEKQQTIDLLTVHEWLKDHQQIEPAGGLSYLASLPDKVPSAANLEYYAAIVWEKYLLRRMISACTSIAAELYDCEGDVSKRLDEIETRILQLNEERVEARASDIKSLVRHSISLMEHYSQSGGALDGLATGFLDFDRMTNGLKAGEMIVIAARPSMGKTSLAMNIAEHVAVALRQAVGVFSLEMTAESLVMRLLCSHARVNFHKMRGGFLSHQDFPKLVNSAGILSGAPLFIDDSSGLSILQLRAKARRMKQQHDIKLFVIDYLQLLHSTASRARDNRQQEIADISNGIKALSKELRVPVIVLSQLNRDVEKEKGRKPRLSDLRESGAIEQDADLVGLLYKVSEGEDEEGEAGGESEGAAINLLIAKQRNGPTGDVALTFLRNYTRFESAAKIGAEDMPG